jgi:hypothetical protein
MKKKQLKKALRRHLRNMTSKDKFLKNAGLSLFAGILVGSLAAL